MDLPSVDNTETPKAKPKKKKKPDEPMMLPIDELTINIPSSQFEPVRRLRRCDVQSMTQRQGARLLCITNGLESRGAKLDNGVLVTTPQHAVKWMLENLVKK